MRCACGSAHATAECTAANRVCCLCNGDHAANWSECPVLSQKSAAHETMERLHRSRYDALAIVKQRLSPFAAAVADLRASSERAVKQMIDSAFEKAAVHEMDSLVAPLFTILFYLVVQKVSERLLPPQSSPPPSQHVSTPKLSIASANLSQTNSVPPSYVTHDISVY